MSTRYFWPDMSRSEHIANLIHDISDEDLLAVMAYRRERIKSYRGGAVYLCKNLRNGYVKIGYSNMPAFREKTLQSEEPDVRFIAVIPGTVEDERRYHNQYKEKRIRGEWFNLTDQDVYDIVEDTIPF